LKLVRGGTQSSGYRHSSFKITGSYITLFQGLTLAKLGEDLIACLDAQVPVLSDVIFGCLFLPTL
jgi:hypothetical protein